MRDIDRARAQRDAKRSVANRPTTGSSRLERAMLRRLSVELYKERRRRDNAADESGAP
ncbi:hypothetical protein [Kribbella sp. NBC_00889]|uniref:hypothetical protein n=1 Tax=Kribbella sp. NBC_00889 TaxID=2975974 RepID=UPI0038709C2A|nr:hypothetical protein OG817_25730 [Kribbella sp. NBC_00889]